MVIATNFATRESFVEAIKQAGLYIADHAENLLGEYPALLSEIDITAHFRFDEPVTVEVRRLHIACDKEDYPKHSESVPWYARGGVFIVDDDSTEETGGGSNADG